MSSSANRVEVAVRLSGYLGELQELFSKYDLLTGSPSDIETGTRKLSEGGTLAPELSAMLRSIVYREHEEVTEADLTELLLASLGGEAAEAGTELSEPTRRVHGFLAVALRSFRRSGPDAPYRSRLSKEPFQPEAPRPAPKPTPLPGGAAGREAEPPSNLAALPGGRESADLASPRLQEFVEPSALDDPNMAHNQDAIAREVARMLEQDRNRRGSPSADWDLTRPPRLVEEVRLVGESERLVQPFSQPAAEKPIVRPAAAPLPPSRTAAPPLEAPLPAMSLQDESMSEDDGVFPEYQAVPFLRPEHRTLWIVGLCCLLLGLIVGLLVRGHQVNPQPPGVDHGAGSSATSQLTPSPHPAFAGHRFDRTGVPSAAALLVTG